MASKASARERMRDFAEEEAAAILEAAARETRPSIRWLPFLCAASGACVGEMAQLRREDVIEKNGIPALRITGEAGSVKTLSAERVIPIHAAVLAADFLAFVETRQGPSSTTRSGGVRMPRSRRRRSLRRTSRPGCGSWGCR